MQVRPIDPQDHDAWFRIRKALWPACPDDTLGAEMASIRADGDQAVFAAVRGGGGPGGFAEVSIHPHALGCETQPVGYLEGWWVDPDLRRTGLGRRLLAAAEDWARAKGCREMASDTDLGNAARHAIRVLDHYGRVVLRRPV